MIKKFLQSLEDPNMPYFGPNYWLFKKLGLIFPENLIKKYLYILIQESVTVLVVTMYIEIYFIRSDQVLLLTNLRISVLSIVVIAKTNAVIFWQDKWKAVIEYMNAADTFERNTDDPSRKNILEKYTAYSRRLTYGYYVLVLITCFSTVTGPPIHYVTSSSLREKVRNGTEPFPHIFSSWVPFDRNASPGCWIVVIFHATLCGVGGSIMAAYDSSVIVIMVFFGGKLDLLRERCKKMLGTDGVPVSDDEAESQIRELHKIHIDIIKYSTLFNSIVSPVMFLYVVLCSLMLCASAYQLTVAVKDTTELLVISEYLIFGIAQLAFICWHSNDVLLKILKGAYSYYTLLRD